MLISRSGLRYQERTGLRPTYRLPNPRYDEAGNPAHDSSQQQPPNPLPGLLYGSNGNPAPDTGLTKEWPYGSS